MKNKSLILVLSLILTSTTHLLAKDFGNLIAYYTFDNIKNNTIINEVDNKAFTGKIEGAPKIEAGKFGKGISFAGKAEPKRQYIDIEEAYPYGDTDLSISLWGKVPKGANNNTRVGIIMGNYNKPNNCNIELHALGQVRWWWNNGERDHKATRDLRDEKWHHLVFIRDKSNKKFMMYIDGKVEREADGDVTDVKPLPQRIGGDKRGDNSHWFHGWMDDFAIWTEVLDTKSIKEIMEKGVEEYLAVTNPITTKGRLAVFWAKIKS